MKIFYYFRELKTPMYWWQRTHFMDELQRKGHEIITFNPLNYPTIEDANQECLKEIRKSRWGGWI